MVKLPELKPLIPDDPTSSTTGAATATLTNRREAASNTDEPAALSGPHAESELTGDVSDVDTWSGISTAATYRLPIELLRELDKRVPAIGLNKGATISAALVELLARDDEELVRRVDAFQDRYDRARRRARRAA